MLNWKYTTLLAALLVSTPAFAKGAGGGGSPGGSANSHSAANSNRLSAADRDTGPARAEDRMSKRGKANTNGPNSLDRDKGLNRAEDRMSKKGTKHQKASKHQAQK
jgi:hypothetical protein